jgi:hypothetical protein
MRQDISVYTAIPFEYEGVDREEYERRKEVLPSYDAFLADFWHRGDIVEKEGINPLLHDHLIDIGQKLNLIIRHLSLQDDKGRAVIPPEKGISLSASGVRFEAEECLAAGSILKLKMILPLFPLVFLVIFSEVTENVMLEDGRYEVSVRYIGLDEEAKDRIITYLFKRQREAIRSERDRS